MAANQDGSSGYRPIYQLNNPDYHQESNPSLFNMDAQLLNTTDQYQNAPPPTAANTQR